MSVQIIKSEGQDMALLPLAEYQHLIELLEDKTDTQQANQIMQAISEGEETFPDSFIENWVTADSRLKVVRQYRGFTLDQLAKQTGFSKSYISKIENRHKQGTVDTLVLLAEALDVDLEILI